MYVYHSRNNEFFEEVKKHSGQIRDTDSEEWKRGAHVRACCCACPPLTFVKCPTNGCLTTYQISVKSVRQFRRCCKGVRIWARAAVPLKFCITPTLSVSNHIPNFSIIRPAVQTRISPLFKKEHSSVLRAPLVTNLRNASLEQYLT